MRLLGWILLACLILTAARWGVMLLAAALVAAAALLGMRQPPAQVVTCHDMGTRLSNRRLRWLFKWSIRRAQGVAMVGRQVHERFTQDGYVPAHKAMTLLNAVPVDDFGITPERRATARAALGLSAGDVVVGCVGRLVELKNHHSLIRLWPDVLARCPAAKSGAVEKRLS